MFIIEVTQLVLPKSSCPIMR